LLVFRALLLLLLPCSFCGWPQLLRLQCCRRIVLWLRLCAAAWACLVLLPAFEPDACFILLACLKSFTAPLSEPVPAMGAFPAPVSPCFHGRCMSVLPSVLNPVKYWLWAKTCACGQYTLVCVV
jgi:hypothetical protein